MKVGYNKETGKITIVIDPYTEDIDDAKLWFRMHGMVHGILAKSKEDEKF